MQKIAAFTVLLFSRVLLQDLLYYFNYARRRLTSCSSVRVQSFYIQNSNKAILFCCQTRWKMALLLIFPPIFKKYAKNMLKLMKYAFFRKKVILRKKRKFYAFA